MEPSEEIRRIVDRFTKATVGGDHEAALARLSEHAGTLIIGNDPGEWWHGATARAIWQRQLEEIGGFPAVTDEIEAWEKGTVGWASCKQTITSAGTSFAGRATYVLRLERDEWKIVQIHWSLAKPNVEFLGRTLTTSLEELERNLQLERPDLSGVLAADGTVTIVFTDIVDSTVLLARLGDQDWLRLLRQHHAAIQEETAAHDGTVVDRQGDGSMLAFSSARRAVSCANSIQRRIAAEHADVTPPLRVRDRHPHRGRAPRRRAILRHNRPLRRPGRRPCARRRDPRIQRGARPGQRLRFDLSRGKESGTEGDRRGTPTLRRRSRINIKRELIA